jgi:argininosuccinate lyase
MQAFDVTLGCVSIMGRIFEALGVNVDVLAKSFSGEIFAADAATRLAADGTPFRDAYKKIASQTESLDTENAEENIRAKTHAGAPGNLGLSVLEKNIKSEINAVKAEKKRLASVFTSLSPSS